MMTHQVFVYGELAKKGMLLQVIGREPLAMKALLKGYERVLDPEIDYYTAAKEDGGMIEGMLLTGITDRELHMFDKFEGVSAGLYDRAMVDIEVHGEKTTACFYVRRP